MVDIRSLLQTLHIHWCGIASYFSAEAKYSVAIFPRTVFEYTNTHNIIKEHIVGKCRNRIHVLASHTYTAANTIPIKTKRYDTKNIHFSHYPSPYYKQTSSKLQILKIKDKYFLRTYYRPSIHSLSFYGRFKTFILPQRSTRKSSDFTMRGRSKVKWVWKQFFQHRNTHPFEQQTHITSQHNPTPT